MSALKQTLRASNGTGSSSGILTGRGMGSGGIFTIGGGCEKGVGCRSATCSGIGPEARVRRPG